MVKRLRLRRALAIALSAMMLLNLLPVPAAAAPLSSSLLRHPASRAAVAELGERGFSLDPSTAAREDADGATMWIMGLRDEDPERTRDLASRRPVGALVFERNGELESMNTLWVERGAGRTSLYFYTTLPAYPDREVRFRFDVSPDGAEVAATTIFEVERATGRETMLAAVGPDGEINILQAMGRKACAKWCIKNYILGIGKAALYAFIACVIIDILVMIATGGVSSAAFVAMLKSCVWVAAGAAKDKMLSSIPGTAACLLSCL